MPYAPSVDLGRSGTYTANIKDFGALGDGVSDDTAPITNAINVVNSVGGGNILFPTGTYITGTQLLYSKVHLIGAGIEATIIKLKSGTNADLLKGSINGYGGTFVNVSAANATGSTGGIYNWSLQDLTLDGNKAGQSSGPSYCLRQYGFGFIIQNVRMRNGYSGGLLSDWNGGPNSGIDSMEAQIINLKIHDCNAIGFEWGGPHDSQISQLLVFNSGSTNIHVGPNATAMLLSNCHGFSPGLGVSACTFLIEGGYGQYSNCVSEGSDTCNTAILAGDIEWIGCHIFGIVGNPALQQGGLQLGQTAGQTPFAGSVNQAAGVTTAWLTSGCLIDANFNQNNLWSINFANETNNVIRATCYNTAGNVILGTPNIQTSYEIYMNGLTPNGTIGKGGGTYHAIKASKADTWGDRTNDKVNINTHAGRFELVNGVVLKTYTDNYSTSSFETLGDTNGTVKFAGDANATLSRQAVGVLAVSNAFATGLAGGAAQTPSTGSPAINIGSPPLGVLRINPAAAVVGATLTPSSVGGQQVTIINESANAVTFAASATSNVALGTSLTIAATSKVTLVWDNGPGQNLWY